MKKNSISYRKVGLSLHEVLETCPSVTFYFLTNSFHDISRKFILPNVIRVILAVIIFGKMHFLLISEKECFMNQKVTEGQVLSIPCTIDYES